LVDRPRAMVRPALSTRRICLSCACPAVPSCQPKQRELSRALGIGRRLEQREEVDLAIVGAGRRLAAAVYGASEGSRP